MTGYQPHGLTTADAVLLIGAVADITAWDDDERETQVTYQAATITGVRAGSWLTITTTGAVLADAGTGEVLGVRQAEPDENIPFADITSITRIRGAS